MTEMLIKETTADLSIHTPKYQVGDWVEVKVDCPGDNMKRPAPAKNYVLFLGQIAETPDTKAQNSTVIRKIWRRENSHPCPKLHAAYFKPGYGSRN